MSLGLLLIHWEQKLILGLWMAQRLRTCMALIEGPSSVPSTHTVGSSVTLASRDPILGSGPSYADN